MLSVLNTLPSGSGAISELARLTGIHRTTLKRLLETLKEQGYLSHDAGTNHYRLTFRVQQLSHGYRDAVAISEKAWPEMYALSKSVIWPCSLLVPEADEMVIRASTRLYSRLSFHPGMPGRRLPMLSTAAGRAYFANVSADEREMLLSMLRHREDKHVELANDPSFLKSVISQTLDQGYAVNFGEWDDEPKFGGIAMPIRSDLEVQAVLNIIFLNRAVKEQSAIPKLVEALRSSVQHIEGILKV